MVNIINQAPAAAFAPAFVMSAAATSVALVADRGREHTRGFAAVAAKRTQGDPCLESTDQLIPQRVG